MIIGVRNQMVTQVFLGVSVPLWWGCENHDESK